MENSLEIIISALLANFIAQLYKFITYLIINKKINIRRLFQTGGMPSSHSSFMMAMTTSTGLIAGFDSVSFAIALIVSFVVMYDAAGLRRSVGRQAAVLNEIVTEIFSEHPHLSTQRFRELLGHTPIEVFSGAILGFIVAMWLHMI